MNLLTLVLSSLLSVSGLGGHGQRSQQVQQVRPATRSLDVVRVLYGHSSNQLYRIDLSGSQIRTIPVGAFGAQITDLAQTADGRLYGVSFSMLYGVDPQTGRAQQVGPLGVNTVNGLVAAGQRLLASSTDGFFFYVDTGTGQATRVGAFGQGIGSSGDLCFGPGNQLFMTSPAGGVDQLVRVDPVTGAATVVGSTGLSAVYGLVYTGSERNELIGLTEGGVVARIDPLSGAGVPLGTTSVSFWGGS